MIEGLLVLTSAQPKSSAIISTMFGELECFESSCSTDLVSYGFLVFHGIWAFHRVSVFHGVFCRARVDRDQEEEAQSEQHF